MTDSEWGCSCIEDADGLLDYVCDHHRMDYSLERRLRDVLDHEQDERFRQIYGDRKLERMEGAVFAFFPVDRKR